MFVSSGAFWAVFVKLFLGSAQYIVQKDAIDAKCFGKNSAKEVQFQRVYFFTACQTLGMLLVVLPLIPGQWRKFRAQQTGGEGGGGAAVNAVYSWGLVLFSAFPAVLDVAAMAMSMKAAVYLPATVAVLLKATRVIFTAGLTSVMLKKRLQLYQWMGVFMTCVALVPIYFETMQHAKMEKDRLKRLENGEPDKDKVTDQKEVIKGLGLLLAAELMRAVRFVYEEWLIKKKHMATEFLLISECTIGTITAVIMCGIVDGMGVEMFDESWARFKSSGSLQALLITFCLMAGICNIAGTFITKYLSSVVNALVSELRVVLVFVPNVIRYKIDEKKADEQKRKVKGEPLDAWSTLKILGFVLLVVGAYVYNGKIKLPCARLRPQPPASPSKGAGGAVEKDSGAPLDECCEASSGQATPVEEIPAAAV